MNNYSVIHLGVEKKNLSNDIERMTNYNFIHLWLYVPYRPNPYSSTFRVAGIWTKIFNSDIIIEIIRKPTPLKT